MSNDSPKPSVTPEDIFGPFINQSYRPDPFLPDDPLVKPADSFSNWDRSNLIWRRQINAEREERERLIAEIEYQRRKDSF